MTKKIEKETEDTPINFAIETFVGPLTININGTVDGEIIKSKSLNPSAIKDFVNHSAECKDYLLSWECANLLRLRAVLLAFISSMFEAFKVERLRIKWVNGSETLDLG